MQCCVVSPIGRTQGSTACPLHTAMSKLTYTIAVAAMAIGVCGAMAAWVIAAPQPLFKPGDQNLAAGNAMRGAQIFALGDCASCHASPGQDDRRKLGGGMALTSAFGTFYVPNISPDPKDGIGRWTVADLANALLAGISPQSTHYYPLFPYTSFTHMKLDDVRDLMAYLRTLPPVSGRPPEHDIPFPLKIRRGIGLWKLLFFDRSPLRDDPSRSTAWNRGHYLVESVGHCAECHSTRNVFEAIKPATRFAGGPDPSDVGYIPNITPEGIGAWSEKQISETLRTGITPDLRGLGSTMAEVVQNTATLPESDRDSMAVYLKTLPARPTPNPALSQ
jgi:mono/diheme cytochrome c family protein